MIAKYKKYIKAFASVDGTLLGCCRPNVCLWTDNAPYNEILLKDGSIIEVNGTIFNVNSQSRLNSMREGIQLLKKFFKVKENKSLSRPNFRNYKIIGIKDIKPKEKASL